jgi:hypothetical protein
MLPYNRAARERVLSRGLDARKLVWKDIPQSLRDSLLDESALLGFEELQDVARRVDVGSAFDPHWMPRPTISASLYSSRLKGMREQDNLALVRLGSEICGVCERRLDWPRGPVQQDPADLLSRAAALAKSLESDKDWSQLIRELKDRLQAM